MRRREWLNMTSSSSFAFLGEVLRRRSARASEGSALAGFGRAKSVLVVFASGGQSQLETFDPRPDAPLEVRGEFGAIESSVPGTFLCEHLPRLAKLANRYAIVKSMSSTTSARCGNASESSAPHWPCLANLNSLA